MKIRYFAAFLAASILVLNPCRGVSAEEELPSPDILRNETSTLSLAMTDKETGKAVPGGRLRLYQVAESAEKQIAVLYGEHFFRVGNLPCDIFADGADEGILVENPAAETRVVEVYDRFGAVLLGKEELAPFSIRKFTFPRTGMIRVRI